MWRAELSPVAAAGRVRMVETNQDMIYEYDDHRNNAPKKWRIDDDRKISQL